MRGTSRHTVRQAPHSAPPSSVTAGVFYMQPTRRPGRRLPSPADSRASGPAGIGEHSARGRYVGQHVPTEATRHQQGTGPSKTGKDRQITTPHTGSTSPAQSAPFTRRHGLSARVGHLVSRRIQASVFARSIRVPSTQPCPTPVDHAGLAVIQGRALAYRTRTQCAHPGRAVNRPCRIPRRDRYGLALLPSRGTYLPTRPCPPAPPR